MEILKFGGASVKDADAIRNLAKILDSLKQNDRYVIVVSAMGKTTNALEEVVSAFLTQSRDPFPLLDRIKQDHLVIAKSLIPYDRELLVHISDLFVEAEWMLEDEIHDGKDYIYDQIVSVGELVSTRIIAAYLTSQGLPVTWLDARDFIKTDECYQAANILWRDTKEKIDLKIKDRFSDHPWMITQGFIGGTAENNTTTLGREGSDYTAAVLAYCLDAEKVVVWKNVAGIFTADPNLFENVIKLDRLSYQEAIEMTYFGAKVIHPKTIQPLKQKGIPLLVNSFEKPSLEGTVISENGPLNYPPIVVALKNQTLLHIASKDFSFIAEDHLSYLFDRFAHHRINVHLMRNTAISFTVCVDQGLERLSSLIDEISAQFIIQRDPDLSLITIRHYNQSVIDKITESKIVFLEETNQETTQLVVKEVPVIKEISK
jgi:aspartate kinase